MKLAFSTTACAGWELQRIVETAQRLGFSAMELAGFGEGMDSSGSMLKSARAMRDMLEPAGLHVCSLATNLMMHDAGEKAWQKSHEGFRQAVAIAHELGAPIVRVFGYSVGRGEGRSAVMMRIARRLAACAAFANETTGGTDRPVTVALQNGGSFVNARELWTILETAGHRHSLGVCWDVGEAALESNGVGGGETASLAVTTLNSRIHLAHVWDHEGARSAVPLGTGRVKLKSFVDRLRGIGYEGCLVYAPPTAGGDVEEAARLLETAAMAMKASIAPQSVGAVGGGRT